MNKEAIAIVKKCLKTKDPYLDLGCLGLSDEGFSEGTELDILLRRCVHLQTLILSNAWYKWDWDANKEWQEQKSRNIGMPNKLNRHPPALTKLTGLKTLIIAGYYNNRWGISDMEFVASLPALT
jgi:hypothetical protein